MKKRNLSLLLSNLLIAGLLVTGCGQTQPANTAPAAPAATTAPAEDSAKVIKGAVETYFNAIGSTVKDSYKIAEDKLKEELDKTPDKYVVLDIRTKADYDKGHIKGAINVPYGADIAKNLDNIRAIAKDKTVIVACYTGQTAGQTDSLLNIAGIKTLSLNFGMGTATIPGNGWTGKKFPTVTEATAMPTATAVTSPSKAIDDSIKKYFESASDIKVSYKLDSATLKKDIDKYYIVDVRKAEDFAKGHIQGAVNIPYGPDIAKNLDSIKTNAKDKTVVVYCYTGQTAGQTDSLLNIAGIKTQSLHFGFGTTAINQGWQFANPNDIVK